MAKRTSKDYPKDVRMKLDKLSQELRKDIGKIEDPKGQALFETAAEVLSGLTTAFEHYGSESEEAWR